MSNKIPLTDAAKRLSISWRALLNGHLEGEKRNGRWYVTPCSVRRYGSMDQQVHGSRATSPTDV